MWFEELTGFKEKNPEQVQSLLEVEGNQLISKVNGKSYTYGELHIPTLKSLKQTSPFPLDYKSQISLRELVADVRALHHDTDNARAVFQAASQFNLLEMVNPKVTPEEGVGIYQYDKTQGPVCAIACGAGTIYRNYFVDLGTQKGQNASKQVDCLSEIAKLLNNDLYGLWKMENGYAFVTEGGLKYITNHLTGIDDKSLDRLETALRVGIQANTEVTVSPARQLVTQVYCSALPVAYSHVNTEHWESFSQLILNATYESTLYAALKNYEETGQRKVFLTLVGGGVFGNKLEWIFAAIKRAILKFQRTPLQLHIVSYGSSNSALRAFIQTLQAQKIIQ